MKEKEDVHPTNGLSPCPLGPICVFEDTDSTPSAMASWDQKSPPPPPPRMTCHPNYGESRPSMMTSLAWKWRRSRTLRESSHIVRQTTIQSAKTSIQNLGRDHIPSPRQSPWHPRIQSPNACGTAQICVPDGELNLCGQLY